MSATTNKPTIKAYEELQNAYDFFNKRLFDGELPALMITFQRGKKTLGYFSPERFSGESKLSELAMNPDFFAARSLADTLSTLVHEMVHVWQHYMPVKKSRGGYHCRIWGGKMESIGLMPSNTAKVGGKKTGQQMSHYIMPNGAFQEAVLELIKDGFSISWWDVYGEGRIIDSAIDVSILSDWTDKADGDEELIEKLTLTASRKIQPEEGKGEGGPNIELGRPITKGASNRSKYNCEGCNLNAWAKPAANLQCGDCNQKMTEVS